MILLTSGTSGAPKGVSQEREPGSLGHLARAALNDLGRIKPPVRRGQPLLVSPPLYHLFGWIGFFIGLLLGCPLVITAKFDPQRLLELMERERVGTLFAVPTHLRRILEVDGDYDTGSLNMILSGAAPLPPSLAREVMDRFGRVLYNGAASTEVGVFALASPGDLLAAPGTVGRPVGGAQIRIVNPDTEREVAVGDTGTIFVRGPLTMVGGYDGGGSKRVVGGMVSTGDTGYLDPSGRLFIVGRDDELVNSGGEKVFPQEVVNYLLTHPLIADAAVIGVPDDDLGQSLAAYVVLVPGATLTDAEIRAYVHDGLARFKTPKHVVFLDELPKTTTGKVIPRDLPRP